VDTRFEAADWAEWRQGWRVVLGVAVGLGTGISLYLLVSSLFVTRITEEFGWSRGDLSLTAAAGFIAGALSLAVVGRLLDRHGYRRVVLVCVPALALVYLGSASVTGSLEVFATLMIIGGIFGTGTGAIAYTRPLIASFDRQRGLALGVAASGTSVAAFIVPTVLTLVIAEFGWRSGFIALAIITLGIGLPLALWLIGQTRRERHVDTQTLTLAELPEDITAQRQAPSVSLRDAMRGSRFWLLVVALVAINIPGSGLVGQLAPLLSDKGFSDTATGIGLSIYAVGLMAGRLLTGYALDRLPVARVAAVMTGVPALGVLILLVPEPSLALAYVAVALIGLQQGSELDLLAYFISRSFGYAHYSSIFGAIATAGALSTASGLVLFGQVHDMTGTYTIALIIGAFAFLVGATAFFATSRLGHAQAA
jgi:sugar phosphate permease